MHSQGHTTSVYHTPRDTYTTNGPAWHCGTQIVGCWAAGSRRKWTQWAISAGARHTKVFFPFTERGGFRGARGWQESSAEERRGGMGIRGGQAEDWEMDGVGGRGAPTGPCLIESATPALISAKWNSLSNLEIII